MAPIEHVPINDNLFVGQLSHQNVAMMNKNNLYDLNINRTQINSVPDYSDKQLIEKIHVLIVDVWIGCSGRPLELKYYGHKTQRD